MHIHRILNHNLIGKLSNHFLVFLINVMIVRILGAENSGHYFNELYVISFIVSVCSLGLDFAIIRLVTQEPTLASRLKWMMLFIVLLFGFVAIILLSVTPISWSAISVQPELAILLFSIGNIMLVLFQALLSAVKRFNTQNLILAVLNIFFLGWLFYYSNHLNGNPTQQVAFFYGILFFLHGAFMFFFCPAPSPESTMRISWKALLNQGFLIMISSVIYFAFLRVDNLFVAHYCTGLTLGNYVQCGKVGQYFLYFSSIISATMLPFMRTAGIGDDLKSWSGMMKPYVLLLLLAVVAVYLTGNFLFPFFFGDSFTEMYTYMTILLPGYFCLGLLTLLNAVFIGKGNIKRILLGDIAGLLIVLAGDMIFIPFYGAKAAAIVSSVAYCLVFIFLLAGLRKQFAAPVKDIEFYKK